MKAKTENDNNPKVAFPAELLTENGYNEHKLNDDVPSIIFITSYPPRECGVATYSQDLVAALVKKFSHSFKIFICPLESDIEKHHYADASEYVLNTHREQDYIKLAAQINTNDSIFLVLIQHEFGFFENYEAAFAHFLGLLTKPIIIALHTVLPNPNEHLKQKLKELLNLCKCVVVMTNTSSKILVKDYKISPQKIKVIAHGTHLVKHADKEQLKKKYNVAGRKVLSTFGLLSSGKSIETTLLALPPIVAKYPDVLFLIIGKTHPSVLKLEGEIYRESLEAIIHKLDLGKSVKFINSFLPLPNLLEYLQLTDIYLFTSKNPNQAVSGTFSYAISCGCPIISTPIPHAREVLKSDAGIIIDFENPKQLMKAIDDLLADDQLRNNISSNGLHRMASTAWENSAIAHGRLFSEISKGSIDLKYNIPKINLSHIQKMTTEFGMIQFAKIDQPDIDSGYTLDDNARAMVAMCQHFELTKNYNDIQYITIYFNFIKFCLQTEGYFLNYVNENKVFTDQNNTTNLADSNGRAIWALGYLISLSHILPPSLVSQAEETIDKALYHVNKIHSTRAMAFVIKGLYYINLNSSYRSDKSLLKEFADRMVQMYRHESEKDWFWFESYLTYGNSILPEAMLCAWMDSGEPIYKEIAKASFDFLLSKTFNGNSIKIISNKSWLHRGDTLDKEVLGGEQPIDVAYTILALSKFYLVFHDKEYYNKMQIAFDWFLGNNHLHQIIYNPTTGGCYDGLEGNYVNLNQGAESTVSYMMSKLTLEKLNKIQSKLISKKTKAKKVKQQLISVVE